MRPLDEERRRKRLSLQSVADATGYNYATVADHLRGRYPPPLPVFVDYADVLGLDVLVMPRGPMNWDKVTCEEIA